MNQSFSPSERSSALNVPLAWQTAVSIARLSTSHLGEVYFADPPIRFKEVFFVIIKKYGLLFLGASYKGTDFIGLFQAFNTILIDYFSPFPYSLTAHGVSMMSLPKTKRKAISIIYVR